MPFFTQTAHGSIARVPAQQTKRMDPVLLPRLVPQFIFFFFLPTKCRRWGCPYSALIPAPAISDPGTVSYTSAAALVCCVTAIHFKSKRVGPGHD